MSERSRRLDQPREPGRLEMPRFDPEAFGKWSEGIARFMGTAKFLVYMTVAILLWVGWNTLAPAGWRVDPYTFTFLTLLLSLQASYAAPLILLAQNRQADRDRLTMEEDRRRAAMQKADTEYLARELAALRIAVGEMASRDFLRSELSRLAEELDAAAHRRHKLERKHGQKDHRRAARKAEAAFAEPLDEPLDGPAGESVSERRDRRSGGPIDEPVDDAEEAIEDADDADDGYDDSADLAQGGQDFAARPKGPGARRRSR